MTGAPGAGAIFRLAGIATTESATAGAGLVVLLVGALVLLVGAGLAAVCGLLVGLLPLTLSPALAAREQPATGKRQARIAIVELAVCLIILWRHPLLPGRRQTDEILVKQALAPASTDLCIHFLRDILVKPGLSTVAAA